MDGHNGADSSEHDCEQPPRLQNQRPLGIDRLEQIFRANTESRLMELFLSHFRQTGCTLKQVFLGTPAYGTIDPANLEAIMSTNFQGTLDAPHVIVRMVSRANDGSDWSMGPRRKITFPMFGDGIFTQDGESWKRSREILRPQFHYREYADLNVFRESVEDLLAAVSAGGVADLQPLFFRLTLDTTTAFLFGKSVRSLRDAAPGEEQKFGEAFNVAQEYVAKRFRFLDLYWLIGGRKFREACWRVHAFADQIIARNLAASFKKDNEDKYVFLRSLANKTSDRAALRGQIINILTAGRDTTACLLSWTFFLIVRHPQVLAKLQAEIAEVDKAHTGLNRDVLRNMKYLQNVLKESKARRTPWGDLLLSRLTAEALRLYPSVPVNTRTARRTTTLPTGGGPDRRSPVLIPKGSAVAFSPYAMHRRPDLFGMDAEIFRPERWDEDLPLHRDPVLAKWGYLPFNGGPRMCLGMDFALVEAAYVVVRLLQEFPCIQLAAGSKVELTGAEKQTMTLVISITEGCIVDLGRSRQI